jgi:hypothetical protein
MTRYLRSWLRIVSSGIPTRRQPFLPRLLLLEDRTLPSVQFTPAPYAMPANQPDTALTAMSGGGNVEPYLSVNPADPGNIAVSSQNGIRVSTNAAGGFTPVTQFPGSLPGGDTSTTFDSAGRLFWVNITSSGGLTANNVTIAQVDPNTGGVISKHLVDQVPDGTFQDDKEWIAADPTDDNLYVIWTRFGPGGNNSTHILMRYSSDHGASWSDPVQVDNGSDNFAQSATVTVAPNHMVYAAYHSVTDDVNGQPDVPDHDGKIVVVRFNNDLTDPVRSIAEAPGRADITFNTQDAGFARQIPGATFTTGGNEQPWVLADPVRPGNIYVVSADSNNGFHQDYGDIRLARSTDYGLTWSSNLIETSSTFFPNAAIDQNGDIVVSWRDNRRGLYNSAGHFKLDVYATYSTDGGLTFAPAFPVNDQTPGVNTPDGNIFDPDPGAPHRHEGPPPTTRIGEYFATGIWDGTAYVAWNGNTFAGFNNPVGQQVWMKAFAIRGSLTVTGTAGNDFITVRSMADNPAFVEVIVNGQRQYAGLWSALTGITIEATPGDDYIQIDDTVAGTPVTVNLGDGTDTVDLGRATTDLDSIQGPLVVHGGSGADTLFLRDANHAGNVTYTIAGATFSRTGSATVSYDHIASVSLGAASVNTVNVLGTFQSPVTVAGPSSPALNIDDRSDTSDTTYTITGSSVARTGSAVLRWSTPSLSSTAVNTGSGIDTVNVRGTTGPLFINSGSGADTITLSNSTATLGGIGHVIVNNPSNSVAVTVDDSGFGGSTTYALTSSQVTAAAWPSFLLVYNNLASLNLNGGSGDDSFDIESTAGPTTTTATGGSGNNRFDLTPTAQYLAAVGGPLSLLGGGADTLVFWDSANPNAETYTFDAIPSNLTLTTVPVSINFFGMATVYLETNGMSTVNDPSGEVLVDVPPPSAPDTAQEPPPVPSLAAADGLVPALLDAAQNRPTVPSADRLTQWAQKRNDYSDLRVWRA